MSTNEQLKVRLRKGPVGEPYPYDKSTMHQAADEIDRLEGEVEKWMARASGAVSHEIDLGSEIQSLHQTLSDRDFQALVTLTAALLTREGYDAEGAAHDAFKALAAIKEHTDGK